MKDNIIEYAKQIAIYRNYPRLENGLQPLEDYEVAGQFQPGLNTKYQNESLELRDAFADWQSGKKTVWHVMHEAADVYYYCRQIEQQSNYPLWTVVYASIKNYIPFEWGEREVQEAADAKYSYRSSGPNNKNEEHELQLIQERIENGNKRFGAPRKNQYARKDVPGRTMGLYLSSENIIRLREILKARGATVEKVEEDRLARALFKLAVQEEYENLTELEN
jgi:hypothetical protein